MERAQKPARVARPKASAAKPAAPRKRAATPKLAEAAVATTLVAELTSPRADRSRRRRALAAAGLVLVAASAAAVFVVLRGDARTVQPQVAAAGVSAETLTSFASSHNGPVYWAGQIASRKLELTTTRDATFVRYLPLSATVGDSERATTVATYPLRNAYATATARAKTPQMTSRETAGGGLAVWSRTRPTSVYLAFPGVPHLVEIYAPNADQARTLALSGRIRPVS